MSPLIEIILFFTLCITLWSWRGLLAALGISIIYVALLRLAGKWSDQKDEPPR